MNIYLTLGSGVPRVRYFINEQLPSLGSIRKEKKENQRKEKDRKNFLQWLRWPRMFSLHALPLSGICRLIGRSMNIYAAG